MCEKHIKVHNLLEDKDICNKIVTYLHVNKFKFYLSDFVNYVSNIIFLKLGIDCTT